MRMGNLPCVATMSCSHRMMLKNTVIFFFNSKTTFRKNSIENQFALNIIETQVVLFSIVAIMLEFLEYNIE